jgi:hypothetical protein
MLEQAGLIVGDYAGQVSKLVMLSSFFFFCLLAGQTANAIR